MGSIFERLEMNAGGRSNKGRSGRSGTAPVESWNAGGNASATVVGAESIDAVGLTFETPISDDDMPVFPAWSVARNVSK